MHSFYFLRELLYMYIGERSILSSLLAVIVLLANMRPKMSVPVAINSNPRAMGRRIKRGLEELGELDARSFNSPEQKKPRKETKDIQEVRRTNNSEDNLLDDSSSISSAESSVVVSHVFNSNWDDWREAKRAVFSPSSSVQDKQEFISFCSLWHSRERAGLREVPPYIEATELLVSAMLLDQENTQPCGIICQSYGAALSRLVHVMTGSFAREGGLDTYRKRAKQIGLPEEAVEVRQRFAHGNVPHITELRWVSALVMQFLFQTYWLEQETEIQQMEQQRAAKKKKAHQNAGNYVAVTTSGTVPEMKDSRLNKNQENGKYSIMEIKEFLQVMESEEGEERGRIEPSSNKDDYMSINHSGNHSIMDGGIKELHVAGWRIE